MISSLEDAERLLCPARYLGVAPRPLYLLPLLRLGALSTLLTREAADLGWAERFGTEMLSLEEQIRARGRGLIPGRSDWDELIGRLPALVDTRWHGREFGLASYGRFRARWLPAFEQVGARLLTPTRPGKSVPRDKIAMRDWLAQLGVPIPASVVVGSVDYPVLRRRLGTRFVAQLPTGAGGSGTYLITDEDTARALPSMQRWLVSEYAGDTTVNFHGFLAGDGVAVVLRPSLQLTNVEGIGSAFGGFSGSDFKAPARLSGAALSRCQEAMERIGWGLGDLGYRGVFGVDFAVRGDTAAALEINCRIQGSTWLLGEAELCAGELPTMVRHVLERHGFATTGKPDLDAAGGIQLIIRHTGAPRRLLRAPQGGVYRLEGNRLSWHAEGCGLLECGPEDCVLVNVPRPGTLMYPGSVLARLVTRTSVTSLDGKAVNEYGRRVTDALHALYSFDAARC
jgi:hypothetical protein